MATYRFICRFPDKYVGKTNQIVARSKWELMYMQALDNSPSVLRWISEPKTLNISYISPLDKKVHQYWPDFLVQYVDGSIELLEIKPLKESLAEKAVSTYDKLMLAKNIFKWKAAERFARSIGGRFRVITENNLFARVPPKKRTRRGTKK